MTIERKAVYRFHARTAKAFRKGRVFLAGDAAHITPAVRRSGAGRGIARRRKPFLEDRVGPARPRLAEAFSTAMTKSVALTPRR